MNEIVPTTLMSFIERASRDDTFDVNKFEALLRMQRDETHEQARRAFNAAMAACQHEMEPVLRGASNPAARSKYAKLEAIDAQMRPIYTRHGFSVRFGSAQPPQPGWMRITCTVAHEAGFVEENYLDSPVSALGSQGGRTAMTPVQAVGSVVTYLRRYLLAMVFNIVQADIAGPDDDGQGEVPQQKTAPPEPEQRGKSWKDWMTSLEIALHDSRPVAEISRTLAQADVQQIYERAGEGEATPAKQRILALVHGAQARLAAELKEPDPDDAEAEAAIASWEAPKAAAEA